MENPGRFLIPLNFPGCKHATPLADLAQALIYAYIRVEKSPLLPELTPTCMTLELADRSISEPIGIAEDVYVTVGKFQYPCRYSEPLHSSGPTLRYTANYNHMTANRIDVIDMACEEYSQEVLGFSNVISSGNPTPYYDPIVSTVSPTLTPFGDIDPSHTPPLQGNYFPETRKDLKICEANNEKSLVNEPPEVELKDLPPHLEYAFLEGDDKFPVIIAKDLKRMSKRQA
ncbi:hypothetical protein Tco_0468476 [Tanacetum coccineum]